MPDAIPMAETGILPRYRSAAILGGVAGNHTVTGIAVGDSLASVQVFTTVTSNFQTIADITSEFTITAANTINNTGGTDTTADYLTIVYYDNPNT